VWRAGRLIFTEGALIRKFKLSNSKTKLTLLYLVAALVLVATVFFFEVLFRLHVVTAFGFYHFSLKTLLCAFIAILIYYILGRKDKLDRLSMCLNKTSIKLFFLGCVVSLVLTLIVFSVMVAFGGDMEYARFGAQIIPLAIEMFGVAVYEEIFFRGLLLFLAMLWMRPSYAIVFSSIIFALLHAGDRAALGVATQILVALAYAHVVISTNSLWPAIGAHWTYNTAISALVGYHSELHGVLTNKSEIDFHFIIFMCVFPAVAIYFAICLFKKVFEHK
jgi:membrane protease YdiL (CAAX protease family)